MNKNESEYENQNGEMVCWAMEEVGTPASARSIVNFLAKATKVKPSVIKKSVEDTLLAGAKHGYIKMTQDISMTPGNKKAPGNSKVKAHASRRKGRKALDNSNEKKDNDDDDDDDDDYDDDDEDNDKDEDDDDDEDDEDNDEDDEDNNEDDDDDNGDDDDDDDNGDDDDDDDNDDDDDDDDDSSKETKTSKVSKPAVKRMSRKRRASKAFDAPDYNANVHYSLGRGYRSAMPCDDIKNLSVQSVEGIEVFNADVAGTSNQNRAKTSKRKRRGSPWAKVRRER